MTDPVLRLEALEEKRLENLEKEIRFLEEEIRELRKFKERIELGSYWFRCAIYTLGGVVAFLATAFTIIRDWPFGK